MDHQEITNAVQRPEDQHYDNESDQQAGNEPDSELGSDDDNLDDGSGATERP